MPKSQSTGFTRRVALGSNKCRRCKGSGREPDQVETGLWFRAHRQQIGVSLRLMSKRLGISPSFLSNLEQGRRVWTEEVRNAYKAALTK